MVDGGNANSSYNDIWFGGNSNSNFTPNEQDLIFLLNQKLYIEDSCWSSFNAKYRYYRFLVENSRCSSFYQPTNLPTAPVPADNSTLDC